MMNAAILQNVKQAAKDMFRHTSRGAFKRWRMQRNFMGLWRRYAPLSEAQNCQDVFALCMLSGKRNGYFVEFGACDGVAISNTLLLERQFGWSGILAEPAQCWTIPLRNNRRAKVDLRCVWNASGENLMFREANSSAELSTLEQFTECDDHASLRSVGKTYPVETVSLNDLLVDHGAPVQIDFLSIDTEGSELAILEAFDFSRHTISVLCIEHNFVEPVRRKIQALLLENGFFHVFPQISGCDDWYVCPSLIAAAK